ncbi:MAG: class I SAM-dependent methyltransferase [Cytophagia bacterium]|nr:class I SAM-dependent methyltransferase [Cytophagia bacterium]
MDAEKLRNTYNQYFRTNSNHWSSTDLNKTKRVAIQTRKWLIELGLDDKSVELLDVGCAMGYYTEAFRQLGWNTTGLDYSEVAIENATKNFPKCSFIQMNGFEPEFNKTFDVIFCRGFSGMNTHNLDFISTWVNKYLKYLNTEGYFVLSYSSDFSGKEKEGETVNHSSEELRILTGKVTADYLGMHVFHYFGKLSELKKKIQRLITRKNKKEYYYLIFRRLD